MKHALAAAVVTAATLLSPLAVNGTAAAAPLYANCSAAMAAGQSNILRGEPGYRPALDRDDDGIACERDDPASASGGAGAVDEDSNSDDLTGAVSQVSVVPESGVEAGDGSTAGGAVWWLGGLVAGAAGAGMAARLRRP